LSVTSRFRLWLAAIEDIFWIRPRLLVLGGVLAFDLAGDGRRAALDPRSDRKWHA